MIAYEINGDPEIAYQAAKSMLYFKKSFKDGILICTGNLLDASCQYLASPAYKALFSILSLSNCDIFGILTGERSYGLENLTQIAEKLNIRFVSATLYKANSNILPGVYVYRHGMKVLITSLDAANKDKIQNFALLMKKVKNIDLLVLICSSEKLAELSGKIIENFNPFQKTVILYSSFHEIENKNKNIKFLNFPPGQGNVLFLKLILTKNRILSLKYGFPPVPPIKIPHLDEAFKFYFSKTYKDRQMKECYISFNEAKNSDSVLVAALRTVTDSDIAICSKKILKKFFRPGKISYFELSNFVENSKIFRCNISLDAINSFFRKKKNRYLFSKLKYKGIYYILPFYLPQFPYIPDIRAAIVLEAEDMDFFEKKIDMNLTVVQVLYLYFKKR